MDEDDSKELMESEDGVIDVQMECPLGLGKETLNDEEVCDDYCLLIRSNRLEMCWKIMLIYSQMSHSQKQWNITSTLIRSDVSRISLAPTLKLQSKQMYQDISNIFYLFQY